MIERLAAGGVSLIVPGFIDLIRSGQAGSGQTGFHNDSTAQAFPKASLN
jgi:hypothetical protein